MTRPLRDGLIVLSLTLSLALLWLWARSHSVSYHVLRQVADSAQAVWVGNGGVSVSCEGPPPTAYRGRDGTWFFWATMAKDTVLRPAGWGRLGVEWQWDVGSAVPNVRRVVLPLWLPALLLAVPPAFAFVRGSRRRARRGLCPECGYDLRVTPSRCPECGRAATVAPL